MKKTVGIIFADAMEYAPFLEYARSRGAAESTRRGRHSVSFDMTGAENEVSVVAVECGIGKVNAAMAAAYLIADDKADAILNAGLSGAVSGVRREDIVAGESYVECDFDLRPLGYDLAVKPGEKLIHTADERLLSYAARIDGVILGRLGTGDQFLADAEKKSQYRKAFGLTAFDMETAAIAAVCTASAVPFLSIRKISDNAEEGAFDDYSQMNVRAESSLTEILDRILHFIADDVG